MIKFHGDVDGHIPLLSKMSNIRPIDEFIKILKIKKIKGENIKDK